MKKYIVREGDTMGEISQATGVKLNLLMAANPQINDPNQLQPGSLIVIPELGKHGPSTGSATSTQSSPPLMGSAGPTPTSTAPHVGQPEATVSPHTNISTPSAQGTYPGQEYYFGFVWPHVVRAGETWEVISRSYGVPVEQLKRMNPELTKAALRPGEVVYVPSPIAPPQAGSTGPGTGMKPGVAPGSLPYGGTSTSGGGHGEMPWPKPGHMQQYDGGTPSHAGPDQIPMPGGMPETMPGTMPGGMPSYSSDLPNSTTGQPVPGPQMDDYGPHTHNPYRTSMPMMQPGAPYYPYPHPVYPQQTYPASAYPPQSYAVSAWYNDWEESSSVGMDDGASGSLHHHD